MNNRVFKILHLEDDPEDALLIQKILEKAKLRVAINLVENEEDFTTQIVEFDPDIILSDFRIPGYSGLDALIYVQHRIPETPFIYVTGTVGEELAAETILNGASGFVLKSNLSRLPEVVKKEMDILSSWISKSLYRSYFRVRKQLKENKKALEEVSQYLDERENKIM